MKNYFKLSVLAAMFAAALSYAAWPEAGDFTSCTFNLDTKTPQTTITLQNNAALAYNLNWGTNKAASVSIFADGLAGTETAGIAGYSVMASSTTDGYGNTYQWDYEVKTKEELPKGAYTLSHVTYDTTPGILNTLTCSVKLLPEPALAIVLGILGLALVGRRSIKALVLALLAGATISASATSIVSTVNAYPRWPWNGKVDIVYTISGSDATKKFDVAFQVKNGDDVLKMNHVEGTAAKPSATMATDRVTGTGQHILVWDAGADFPGQTVDGLNCYVAAQEVEGKADYLKVDLKTGTITEEAAAPATWTDDDKTKYLWLRRIPATTEYKPNGNTYFVMGSPGDELGRNENAETQHNVTLTKDFYIGVFQLTEAQYNYINGESSPGTSTTAKESVSYDELRGTSSGAAWPNSTDVDSESFIGKLRTKTSGKTASGYHFDLPTEAQWEYACRGPNGWGSTWNDGNAILSDTEEDSNLNKLGWYSKNSGPSIQAVGQKTPNGWGLYDMHGNVFEWCLDWFVEDITSYTSDPKGPTSGNGRVVRGGSWDFDAVDCRSANRDSNDPDYAGEIFGARLVLTQDF